jgi:hypothetical protein
MFETRAALAVATVTAVLAACGPGPTAPVERVGGAQDVSAFALRSLEGGRDGERLEVQAVYGDGTGTLLVRLRFDVTPPARLTSGTWSGLASEGRVRQRSMTFLGGQSGAPSIGGRFDLSGPDDRTLYRISIPLQELKQRRE